MATACPLEPWVKLESVLALYAPELLNPVGDPNGDPIDDPSVAVWEMAICEASWALFVLSGGKVHPEQCWVEDYSTRGSCNLTLRRTPLTNIQSVEVLRQCGQVIEPLGLDDYCITSSQTINLCCGPAIGASPIRGYPVNDIYLHQRCGCHDEVVRVRYQVGSTLPPSTEARVAWLADQYMKAAAGEKCSLPERVTNITRQGVSWTLLDPMEFLDKRFTGIARIDSWLALVRMATPAAEIINPLRSNRLFSEQVLCNGASFNPAFSTAFGVSDVSDVVV